MKKVLISVLAMCMILTMCSGCNMRYKRISYGDSLGDALTHINSDTKVINDVSVEFPTEIPMYRITKRPITDEEYTQVLQLLGITQADQTDSGVYIKRGENSLYIELDSSPRSYFDMSMEELEKVSTAFFSQLPFIDGTYEYTGAQATDKRIDKDGTHILRIGAGFRRVIDGIRVLGNDVCTLYYDGAGLARLYIALYEYEHIGTIKLIPLKKASDRILSPDSFSPGVDEQDRQIGMIDTLEVERISLRYVNQYSRDCEILEPVYSFVGTATDLHGLQSEFKSVVIAIPESYTYD